MIKLQEIEEEFKMLEYPNYNGNPYQPENNEGEKRQKKGKGAAFARRAGMIALSAVLFGGAAGLTFEGVTSLKTQTNQEAASGADEGKVDLVKASAAKTAATETSEGSMSVTDIVDTAMPSVVSITNKSVQEVQDYYGMFGRGGYVTEQETESAGSGIIIGQSDTELLIVSNNHVVENANTLTVGFTDGSVAEANIKGTDSDNDLAVIAVALEDIGEETMSAIKVATVGDSAALKVGEQVVAIGNALGYGQSVTTGIVSALDRQIDDTQESTKLIQTDAAINPGNSGGALLNMQGEVIGINSSKFASTEVEGMCYAIPINTASPILENLMNRTTREKVDDSKASSIGISGYDVSSDVQEQYGMPAGVYVSEVNAGSAAEAAGIQKGSIITKFDGTSITGISGLKDLLQYYEAGETVEIALKAAGENGYTEKTVSITLDAASSQVQEESQESSQSADNWSNRQQESPFSGLEEFFY